MENGREMDLIGDLTYRQQQDTYSHRTLVCID